MGTSTIHYHRILQMLFDVIDSKAGINRTGNSHCTFYGISCSTFLPIDVLQFLICEKKIKKKNETFFIFEIFQIN